MPTQEDEKKPKIETLKGPETPEQAAARAAQDVQEKEAAVALAKAESTIPPEAEKTPETQALQIAEKYATTIPQEDRILDKEKIEKILWLYEGSSDTNPGGLFSTYDRLGNLPGPIKDARDNKDAKRMVEILRAIADDPVKYAPETDKAVVVMKSSLPKSIKGAVILIAYKEGKSSTSEEFHKIADSIEEQIKQGGTPDLGAMLEERYNARLPSDDAIDETDKVRQWAMRNFIEDIYPDLTADRATRTVMDMADVPYEKKSEPQIVAEYARRFSDLTGWQDFAEFTDAGAIKSKNIEDYKLREVMNAISTALREKIIERFTQAESGEIPPETEIMLEARAREIAQRYLATIPEADRKLTDPRQVKTILGALAREKKKLFQTADEIGNLNDLSVALDEGNQETVLKIMRESADNPVTHLDSAQFKQEVRYLPDTVRDAVLAMICKEGKYNFADELRLRADRIEQQPGRHPREIIGERSKEIETNDSSGRARGEQLRTAAVARFLEGAYPDLIGSKEVVLLREMWNLSNDQRNDKVTVIGMAERYNQLHADAVFSRDYGKRVGGAKNGNELLAKLQDGSIAGRDIGGAEGILERELEEQAAKKVASAEAK